MSLPRMSLHIGDYRKDTGHLTAAEHGAYLLLTMHYWTTGGLPDDDRQLARIACMSDKEWKAARPTVAAFFKPGWRHKRIDDELTSAHERSASASTSASHRWSKRNANASETHSDGIAIEPHPIRNAIPSPSQEEEKKEATGSEVEPVRARLRYPAAFEGWWLAYPRTPVMSKKEAIAAWQRLSEPDRLAAVEALPKYAAFLKSHQDHPVVHACRFLSQRRFDGFEEALQLTATAPVGFYAADSTPELDAWDAHYRTTKGVNAPRDNRFGWRFPTQWPPGHEVKNANGSGAHDGAQGRAEAGTAGVSGRENPLQPEGSREGSDGRAAASARSTGGFTIE